MPLLTQPSFGPVLSIVLILVGSLMDVWTLVWRYTAAPETLSASHRFWYWGLLLTGLTLLIVGILIGQIGRAARKAELPPPEAQGDEATIQQTAAANPAGAHAAAPMVGGAAQVPAMPAPAAPVAPGAPMPPVAVNGVQQPYTGVRR
jgi:hypothetical protein